MENRVWKKEDSQRILGRVWRGKLGPQDERDIAATSKKRNKRKGSKNEIGRTEEP